MGVMQIPPSLAEELERMLNSFWYGSRREGGGGIPWMSWTRVCVRKEFGGMGFRDLQHFNLAMLGKQGWKFLTNLDAWVSRVFKAKYFPQGTFFQLDWVTVLAMSGEAFMQLKWWLEKDVDGD
ncbi:Uncharacterized mitochondrial protein AtMg00310 [Linum grandiflorum]